MMTANTTNQSSSDNITPAGNTNPASEAGHTSQTSSASSVSKESPATSISQATTTGHTSQTNQAARTAADKPKIVFDCDPGLDDAIAILTAAYFCDIVGITTVNGNVGIDYTTHNALAVAQIAALDVEVHRGASRPLIAPTIDAARVHGATGLGDAKLPSLTRTVASNDAVGYICDTARSVDELHLVAVGPLTNLALALRRDPDLPKHLQSITIMGGSARIGNVTPVAEFNAWADPEAAAIVFKEAAPVTMVGLDVTRQILFGMTEVDRIREAATPTALFAASLVAYAYEQSLQRGLSAAPIHDAVAVITVTHPHLFTISAHPVTVELQGETTRGMTVVDLRPRKRIESETRPASDSSSGNTSPDNPDSNVVWEARSETVRNLILEAVTTL
ncbi:MAG: nucleoside hydrolase [Acidimicrobiaceae bacterium]|nr:nucleoside hydrolase [Acidimicrobiaceae bacterium]